MNTSTEGSNPTAGTGTRRSFWGWHLLFWAFFFVILGFNVPHGAQVFLAVFGDTWTNEVIAWAFMIGADVIVGYLTVARIQLSSTQKDPVKQWGYMLVLTGISLGSCYLQVLYNAHNFQPHLLNGAQNVPGFGLLPYLLSCLPLLTIVMASMASLVGRPAIREESATGKPRLTHQEKLQAIREKAEMRKARLTGWKDTATAALPAIRKQPPVQQQEGTKESMQPNERAALPSPFIPESYEYVTRTEQQSAPVREEGEQEREGGAGEMHTPAIEFEAILPSPLPPGQEEEDPEEQTLTMPQIRLVLKEATPGYSTRNEQNRICGDLCYSLSGAEKAWGIREGTLAPLFDARPVIRELQPYWYGVIVPNQGKPYRHVRSDQQAQEIITGYLKRMKPKSLLTLPSTRKQGTRQATKKTKIR